MARFLEKLLPTGAAFWYGMNDRLANGQDALIVLDYSGNDRHLISTAPAPQWENGFYNPVNNVYFDGSGNPLAATFAATIKHIFTIARYDGGVNFGASYRGLLSGLAAINSGILVGNLNSQTFTSFSFGAGFQYKKSGIAYLENNQVAPFAKFELLDVSYASGWLLDGLQIGRDRADAARKWTGRVGETIGYGRVLSANESAAVNLYYDLKYGLWRANGTILTFPNPSITGILYRRFYADTPDYKKTTVSHEYEDGGKSFSETSAFAPRQWEVEFNCAEATHADSKAKTDIFDAFYNQARYSRTFNFTDKYGETHTGVRIEDYNRSHSAHKSWSQNCRFRLVKLP